MPPRREMSAEARVNFATESASEFGKRGTKRKEIVSKA